MFLQNIWQDFQSKRLLVTARPARGENHKHGSRFNVKGKTISYDLCDYS